MNVYFDYQIFYLQKYGGISKYFVELAKELATLQACDPKIIAPFHQNTYLSHLEKTDPALIQKLPFKSLSNYFNRQEIATQSLTQKKSSQANTVLHETYYTHRIPVQAPKVITIHDMIYELFNKGTAGEKEVIAKKKKSIEEADAIIAVSQHTKKDLEELYPVAKHKTTVVLHGVSPVDIAATQPYAHRKPYILFVGNRDWYKNFNSLLDVYGAQPQINSEFDIICCGGGSVSEAEHKKIDTLQLNGKIHFLSGSDVLLNSLYKSAACLAYISGYEGFGMPVLEAMRFGCPVLCANNSSLPEVAETAARMIDSKSQHELTQGLHEVLFDSLLRQNLYEAGIKRAAEFTWQKCATETKLVYDTLLK